MTGYAFTIEGLPVPKERARRGQNGHWYTPRATRGYAQLVGWTAREAGVCDRLLGPLRLHIKLWFPDRRRRDLDNVAKAIQDALNGIAWDDDSQIMELSVARNFDRERPRAEVTIQSLSVNDEDPPEKQAFSRRGLHARV
jgi:crossover junction endodeoxyribonuclease RusA